MSRPVVPAAEGPVWLVGLPGAGKSTVGPLLARHLGRPFVDLDLFIQDRTGQSIPDIFRQQGESAFRCLETEALLFLAEQQGPSAVVACGGGVVSRRASRDCLRSSGVVLWLDVPWDLARDRCRVQGLDRPLLSATGSFRSRLPARLRWYERLGRRVDASGAVPEVLQRTLAALLG